MSDPKGRFLWYDLMTTDVQAAQDFYTAVVGWTLTPFNDSYTMWAGSAGPVGGAMILPEEAKAMGAPPHWVAYIGTPDVDAVAARVVELGGTVLAPPVDMPEVGRFIFLADPDGASFAAYTPASTDGDHDADPKDGDFTWSELECTDIDAAVKFYQDVFGWQHAGTFDMGEQLGPYWMFNAGKRDLGGIFRRPPQTPVSAWLYYVHVPDLAASIEAVKTNGGTILNGPMEVPGGDWVARCQDPQGAAFALHGAAPGG